MGDEDEGGMFGGIGNRSFVLALDNHFCCLPGLDLCCDPGTTEYATSEVSGVEARALTTSAKPKTRHLHSTTCKLF